MGSELTALATVIVIDLVLAGDNAIVVGMAAAGLPDQLRRKAIMIGIAAAAVLRIAFAIFAIQLLGVIGLRFAGGILLLWVCWKLWREIRKGSHNPDHFARDAAKAEAPQGAARTTAAGGILAALRPKGFAQALMQIVVADVSMSLDNVLAVAGTARNHTWVLIVGLALSVALMGLAATVVARLMHKYPWISYVGLALIAYVALSMIWEGGHEVMNAAEKTQLF
ncbi:MAG: TerC family protein [Bauldia sp.]